MNIQETNDSLKEVKEEKEKLSSELKNQGNLILPLRNENLRITKENNELHNQMIQLEDNLDKFKLVNNEFNSKVEKERDDFKLLLSQKESLVKKQQTEIDSLKKRITELLDTINTINFSKNNLYRTTSNNMYSKANKSNYTNVGAIEMSDNLDMNNNEIKNVEVPVELFKNELNTFNINKESWANDLRQADKEAEKLRNEIR